MSRRGFEARMRRRQEEARALKESELGELENLASSQLSKTKTRGSLGGMAGGFAGKMALKAILGSALTAATGGAAAPWLISALTAASTAAPVLGAGLGAYMGTKGLQATVDRSELGRKQFRSRGLTGAKMDTRATLRDEASAAAQKNMIMAAGTAMLSGGAGKLTDKLQGKVDMYDKAQSIASDNPLGALNVDATTDITDIIKHTQNPDMQNVLQKTLQQQAKPPSLLSNAWSSMKNAPEAGKFNRAYQDWSYRNPGFTEDQFRNIWDYNKLQ